MNRVSLISALFRWLAMVDGGLSRWSCRYALPVLFLVGVGGLLAGRAVGAEPKPRADALNATSELEYQWEEGYEYETDLQMRFTLSGKKHDIRGRTKYDVQSKPERSRLDAMLAEEEDETREPQRGSGTGFVVHSDGILLTCAHVVHGATKIEVTLKNKTYRGKVLLFDEERDLALIQVPARGLPALPIRDSDRVELAQDIRVIGYPLSDVLGESVKITRGTVSGIIKRETGNRFQVDARVNPGNSGGPVVDMQGRVVGIASEMLVASTIDSVGFAIPSRDALNLMKQKKVAAGELADGPALAGTELAKLVTPSVAFIKVEVGSGGVGTHPRQRLSFYYFQSHSIEGEYSGNAHSSLSGNVVIDTCGEVISCDKEDLLSILYQSPAQLGIERMPGDGRKEWGYSRTLMLEMSSSSPEQSEPSVPWMGPRYPGHAPSRQLPYRRYRQPERVQPTAVTQIPAREEVRYRLLSSPGEGPIRIAKEHEFYTLDKKDEDSRAIKLELKGTFVWDPKTRCVKDGAMKGKLCLNEDEVTIRIPVAMTYETTKKKKEPRKPVALPTPRPRSGNDSVAASEPMSDAEKQRLLEEFRKKLEEIAGRPSGSEAEMKARRDETEKLMAEFKQKVEETAGGLGEQASQPNPVRKVSPSSPAPRGGSRKAKSSKGLSKFRP